MLLWHDYIHVGDRDTEEKHYLKAIEEYTHYFVGGYLKHFLDHSYFLTLLIPDNLFLRYGILPKHPMTSLMKTLLKYIWENKKVLRSHPCLELPLTDNHIVQPLPQWQYKTRTVCRH